MNIFLTHKEPKKAVKDLDDKRIFWMPFETAEMLSMYVAERYGYEPYKYQRQHYNHPVSLWVRDNIINYTYVVEYFKCLLLEYKFRFHKEHDLRPLLKIFKRHSQVDDVNRIKLIYPATYCNCSLYKTMNNVFNAYRQTLIEKWDKLDKNPCKWTNRKRPIWSTNNQLNLFNDGK